MRIPSVFMASLALAVAGIAVPAFAHHGWSGQASNVSEITGTVVQDVSLAGPHATMKVNVDGKVWDVTLAPPFRTQGAGLRAGVIPVGATVTIHGNRNQSADRLEMKTSQVKWGTKVFDVYPERD
jgi:hypothetical protein